jgi:hypothetical protein
MDELLSQMEGENARGEIKQLSPWGELLYYLAVGVTCSGAGTAKPSNWENDKAQKTACDCHRIPSVRCTLC